MQPSTKPPTNTDVAQLYGPALAGMLFAPLLIYAIVKLSFKNAGGTTELYGSLLIGVSFVLLLPARWSVRAIVALVYVPFMYMLLKAATLAMLLIYCIIFRCPYFF